MLILLRLHRHIGDKDIVKQPFLGIIDQTPKILEIAGISLFGRNEICHMIEAVIMPLHLIGDIFLDALEFIAIDHSFETAANIDIELFIGLALEEFQYLLIGI